jgi:hypothetical protein
MTVLAEPGLTLRQLSARKAATTRHYGTDHPDTLEAAAALRTALLAQAIRDAAATLPPLTTAERAELSALLLGGDA